MTDRAQQDGTQKNCLSRTSPGDRQRVHSLGFPSAPSPSPPQGRATLALTSRLAAVPRGAQSISLSLAKLIRTAAAAIEGQASLRGSWCLWDSVASTVTNQMMADLSAGEEAASCVARVPWSAQLSLGSFPQAWLILLWDVGSGTEVPSQGLRDKDTRAQVGGCRWEVEQCPLAGSQRAPNIQES